MREPLDPESYDHRPRRDRPLPEDAWAAEAEEEWLAYRAKDLREEEPHEGY